MASESVVVVDDNPVNLKVLRLMLMCEGYDVRTAQDAEGALALLETFRPRLLLIDVHLPGMSGLELARNLRASGQARDMIIVAVTSDAMKGDREIALAAGCDEH